MIDFHTHQPPTGSSTTIQSLLISEDDKITGQGLFSVGIHPWYTENVDLNAQYSRLKELLVRLNVIAVGEIGLDKTKGAPIDKQIEVFEKQILIAEEVKKPVVIHCVRAWAELLELRKKLKPTTPWAIHGFRGQSELAKQLVESGFFLSFGPPTLNASELLQETIRTVPLNRIFIETDESEASLKYLYTTVSKLKKVSYRNLEEQINFNFAEFFGK